MLWNKYKSYLFEMLKEILNEKAIFALKGYAVLEMRKNVKLVKTNMEKDLNARHGRRIFLMKIKLIINA